MQYNVAQLLKEPTGATRRVTVEAGPVYSGGLAVSYLGDVEFLRTHQGLLVRGKVRANVATTCGRCLNEFAGPCSFDVEEEFFPEIDINTGRKLSHPWDNEGTTIDPNHILDMAEVLRQYALAAQPIKPLCGANCQGLCQECGADLNREECACDEAVIDPRWGALAALLNESKD